MNILGNVEEISGLSLDDFMPLCYTLGSCWQCRGHLGVIFGGLGDYLAPPWGYLGLCWRYDGVILGFSIRHQLTSNIQNTDLIDMLNRFARALSSENATSEIIDVIGH